MHIPQFLLISFCLLLPAYFIYLKKNHSLAMTWIALTSVVDIFNSQEYMNLSAIPLFGIAAIPYLWKNKNSLWQNSSVRIFALYIFLLALLGIYYGFINPWPDLTGARSFKDQAPMRSILHFGRTFCEGMTILYCVLQIENNPAKTLHSYLKAVFVSALVLCTGGLIEQFSGFDFYHFFTGGRELIIPGRLRGLTYEPRGMSQSLAHAILLTPFVPWPRWKYLLVPVFMFFAYYLTISFSSIAILFLGIGILFCFLFFSYRDLFIKNKKYVGGGIFASLIIFATLIVSLPGSSRYYLNERLQFLKADNIAEKLEVFDAASINFLNHNPIHYIFGAGPGMVYLPASAYILERDNYIYRNRIDALPHMGLVLILSNAGIVGLCIFLWGLGNGIKNHSDKKSVLFIIGVLLTAIFLIQIRYFFIFGLASLIARNNLARDEKF